MEQPPHIRALAAAHSILPELPPRNDKLRPIVRSYKLPAPANAACSPPTLPKKTERILIFANTQLCFPPESILRAGDICIHLNRARNATPAVMNKPGTTHWLFVRHSAKTSDWFTPENLNLFNTVLFLGGSGNPFNHSNFSWYREWRGITRKSPTTGFIAANTCRAFFPRTPLLLVGFDPAHNCRTYRWSGHDWNAEADWYISHRFLTFPPSQTVHQIWIGGNMPENEKRWTGHIREAAEKAGWQYRLWTERELLAEFALEPATNLLASVLDFAPAPRAYAFAVDYFRYRVLASYPGIYLDTDFELRHPTFPSVPQVLPIAKNCAAFFLARSNLPFQIAVELAEKKLTELLADPATRLFSPAKCADFLLNKHIAGDGLDGQFINNAVDAAWRAAGLPPATVPYDICAGRGPWWKDQPIEKSTFWHHGTAHWHWVGNPRYYSTDTAARVMLPRPLRLRILISSCAKNADRRAACRETWLANLPLGVSYQFYIGGDTPPVGEPDVLWLKGVDDSYAGLPAKEMASYRAVAHDPGWDWLGQVDDDVYLHIPRLLAELRRLNAEANLVGLSRGGERCVGGAGYFLTPLAVRTILDNASEIPAKGRDDELITRCAVRHGIAITHLPGLMKWISPTTTPAPGNNIISASAGKDAPAVLRAVHAAFPPPQPLRLHIAVQSYNEADPRHPKKSSHAGSGTDRRATMRETWLANLPPGVSYSFIVGTPTDPALLPTDEPDVIVHSAPDALRHMLPRRAAHLRRALDTGADWVLSCDDDLYCHIPRLLSFIRALPDAPALYGLQLSRSVPTPGLCGGAMLFSRYVAEKLLALPSVGGENPTLSEFEDVDLCRAATSASIPCVPFPHSLTHPDTYPTPENDIIFGHWVSPARMRSIHSQFTAAPTIHQIWLGSPLPPREAAWVRSLQLCARRAGIMHRLWTEQELLREFADDPATPLLRRLLELCPTPSVYGVVSDYFKLRILAHDASPAGALYFDADVYPASPDGAFPQLPTDADAYFMRAWEHDPNRLNICAMLRPAGHSVTPFIRIADLSRARLLSFFPAPEACTAETVAAALRSKSVLRIVGPYFQRESVFPTLAAEGYRLASFPEEFIAYPNWKPPTPARLIHYGTLAWKEKTP